MFRSYFLLIHIIEGRKKRGMRREQLLVDLKKERGYWKLKEEALVRAVRRIRQDRPRKE